ncbi:hypothetical protein [Aestuariivirga sp.]|uniref:hypothetical protein n=1 Tax=Aestuariivirga sp. TaxID=2650926 RepID=UPI00391A356D
MKNYPDMDIASEAWRIVWDTYGKVASLYAVLGQGPQAQAAFDGIGKATEIASRLSTNFSAVREHVDRAWLVRTLAEAANASFPFERANGDFDDYAWKEVAAMASELGGQQILAQQQARFEQYSKTSGFTGLAPDDRDKAYNSVLALILLQGDIDRARAVVPLISGADQQEYARMQIGQWLAQNGRLDDAERMAEGMAPLRRSAISRDTAIYLASHEQAGKARALLASMQEEDQTSTLEVMVAQEGWRQAEELSDLLDLGDRARLLVAIMRVQLGQGDLEGAAQTARKVEEVGERAVAFAALSLSASRQGRKDLVSEARNEVLKMGAYKVDLVQIADAETALLFALANLSADLSAAQKSADVREFLDRIVPSAFPDDPMDSMGAGENRARLLIQLAGAQFALGLSHEAHKSIEAVLAMGGQAGAADKCFVLSESAGLAYGLSRPSLGTPAVQQALEATTKLELPMDRALMLTHLAETMVAQ